MGGGCILFSIMYVHFKTKFCEDRPQTTTTTTCYYYLYHWETLSMLSFARQRPRCIPSGREAKPAHVEHRLEKRMIIRKKRTLLLVLCYCLLEANRHNGNLYKLKKKYFLLLLSAFLPIHRVINRKLPLCKNISLI